MRYLYNLFLTLLMEDLIGLDLMVCSWIGSPQVFFTQRQLKIVFSIIWAAVDAALLLRFILISTFPPTIDVTIISLT
jgi:hypothetical protein